MKKLITVFMLVIAVFTLAACKKDPSNKMEKVDKKYEEIDKTDITDLNSFAYATFKELYSDGGNCIYSPASLYMALSMCAEGALNNTYDEIKNTMGFEDLFELRKVNKALYENNYYNNDNGMAKMANSYWLKPEYVLKSSYEGMLETYYYASKYDCDFGDEDLDKMAKWINENTFDFLNVKKQDLEDLSNCDLALVNTIYFNNKWLYEFKKDNTEKETFYLSDNSEIQTDFMYHEVSATYKEYDNFTYSTDRFYNGNTIHYILPKDDKNISDCFVTDLCDLMSGKATGINDIKIHYSVPKFKYQNTHDLKKPLKNLGINDLFDPVNCDLHNLSEEDNYIEVIKQIAGIELSEKGVEAAAVTIIGDLCTSAMPILNYYVIKLDHPFIYYITDSAGSIIFMGAVNNPLN